MLDDTSHFRADAANGVPYAAEKSTAEEAAHLSLELGRWLLVNAADTAQVHDAIARLARGLDFRARLIISYEAMLVTVDAKTSSHTRVGRHLPLTGLDITAVEKLNQVADEAADASLDLKGTHARLAALENNRPVYPQRLTAVMLGLSAASLARLFGADVLVFLVVFLAATVGAFLRRQLGQRNVNPFAVCYATALVSGSIGGIGVRFHPRATQYLSLIAPGMILVPGPPLINGIRDTISNNIGMACARLMFAPCIMVTISLGLFTAMLLTGVGIPVTGPAPFLPLLQDALFSAAATAGFVLLFNTPTSSLGLRAVWGTGSLESNGHDVPWTARGYQHPVCIACRGRAGSLLCPHLWDTRCRACFSRSSDNGSGFRCLSSGSGSSADHEGSRKQHCHPSRGGAIPRRYHRSGCDRYRARTHHTARPPDEWPSSRPRWATRDNQLD